MAKSIKRYLVTENQLRAIKENVMSESPSEYEKGDRVLLLQPVDGYSIPANSEGVVVHVDAAGTVRTEFVVQGQKIVVPIDPDTDQIVKIDQLQGGVKPLEEEDAGLTTADKIINTAVREGILDAPNAFASSSRDFVISAAKRVAEKWDQISPEQRAGLRDSYYNWFLKLIGYKKDRNDSNPRREGDLAQIGESKKRT